MTAEWAAIYITIFGGLGTAGNLWLSVRVANSILKLELKIAKEYATKDEVEKQIGPIRENLQLVWSSRSLRDKGALPNA